MMRTVLAAPRRRLICLLALAASVAVLSALPDGRDVVAKEEAPAKKLPTDLALVPADALGFMSLRSAELWKDLGIKGLRDQVLKNAPAEVLAGAKEIEPWLPQIERLTLVLLPPAKGAREPRLAVVVLTIEPYDQKKILAYKPNAKTDKVNGKTLYSADDVAYYPVDKTTFVLGQPDGVASVMEQEGKNERGPLAPALAEAAGRHHIAIGMSPAPFFTLARIDLPPEAKPFTDLIKPEVASLTFDFAKEIKTELRLAYANADDADDLSAVARAAVVLARRGLPVLRTRLEKDTKGTETVQKLLENLEPALKSAKIEAKDKSVTMALTIPVDLATLNKAVVEAVKKIQEAAQRMTSGNNLHQMTLAMVNMADSEQGKFPRAAIYKDGKPLLSWRVALLPYLDQEPLYKEFHLDEPWDSEHNKKLLAKMPKVYLRPGSPAGETKTHYRVLHGPHAAFEGDMQLIYPAAFSDGTSQTILVAEAEEAVPWTKPEELSFDPEKELPKLGYKDKDYFMVGMADGSTRYVKKTISKETLKAAITRDANDTLGDDW